MRSVFLAALCVLVVVPGGAVLAAQQPEPTFLGFRPGDEARYALEYEGGQSPDRIVQWSITLLRIDESGSVGTFELTYLVVVAGERLAQAIGEARINPHGFPLNVRFGSERSTTAGSIGYTIEYRFEEKAFRKLLVGADLDSQEIEIDDVADVEASVPSGLYLYNPIDSACADAFMEARVPDDATTSGGPGDVVIEELCGGRELIFANPGLLDLAIPAMWQAGTGALDFIALAPTGMRLDLLTGPMNPSGGMSVGPINLAALLGGGPDPFHDGAQALQPFALRSGSDLLQLDLGGRSHDVWRLETPAPFADVYVDGDGSILRLDLPRDSATASPAWIRKLRPSEF